MSPLIIGAAVLALSLVLGFMVGLWAQLLLLLLVIVALLVIEGAS